MAWALTVKELREIADCNVRERSSSCPAATPLRAFSEAAGTACLKYRGARSQGPAHVVWWTLKGLVDHGVEVYVRAKNGTVRSARTSDGELSLKAIMPIPYDDASEAPACSLSCGRTARGG